MKKLLMRACLTVFAFGVAAPAFADETTAEETTIAAEGLKDGMKDGLKNGHKKSQTADE